MGKKTETSDHDLLVSLGTKMDILQAYFTNHLKHHLRANIALFTTGVTIVLGLLTIILTHLLSGK
jgi:hypothetical protein